MIAIAVDIRSTHAASSETLSRMGTLLRRHTHVDVGDEQMIVDLPSLGHALVSEHDGSVVVDAVVDDELGVKRFAVALLSLLDVAANGADFRESLSLEWHRPANAPVPLR